MHSTVRPRGRLGKNGPDIFSRPHNKPTLLPLMRYRLRTLLILLAVVLPLVAGIVWIGTPSDPNVPRDARSKKATTDFRQLLSSATSLEIVEAGDAVRLRSNSFQGKSLERLAGAATIVNVDVSNIPTSIVANAYMHIRLTKDGAVLQEYWFHYPDSLVDDSPKNNPDGYWTRLTLAPKFANAFLDELTTNLSR